MDNKKTYGIIGDVRILDIKVIKDKELIYEGMVEDAPEEIKKMKYTEIRDVRPMVFIVE